MNNYPLSESQIIALMLIEDHPLYWGDLETLGLSDVELFVLREVGLINVSIGRFLQFGATCSISRKGIHYLAEALGHE